MSEEVGNNKVAAEVVMDDWNDQDWFLEETISVVVNAGVEIGITLTVGGQVISGILISGKKYFEELGGSMKEAATSEEDMWATLGEAWAKYTSVYEKADDPENDPNPLPVGFIHLRNARYFAPGQNPMPSEPGMLWRGKLSSVDGFTIGNFEPSEQD